MINQVIERGHEVVFVYNYKTAIDNPDVMPEDFQDTRERPQPIF